MVDELALRQIFSLQNATWTLVALMSLFIIRMWNGAPAMFAQWVEWRRAAAEARIAEAAHTASEKAADWTRLREEIARLSEAERNCRADFDQLHQRFVEREDAHSREIIELRAEIAELRGYMTGQGMARQLAAGVVALDRADERNKDQPPSP